MDMVIKEVGMQTVGLQDMTGMVNNYFDLSIFAFKLLTSLIYYEKMFYSSFCLGLWNKYSPHSFNNCLFLAKECAQYWLTA